MKLATILASLVLAVIPLDCPLMSFASDGGSNSSATISVPSVPAIGHNVTIIFINQTASALSSDNRFHFSVGRASAQTIIANELQSLQAKSGVPINLSQVDVELPLTIYNVSEIEHAIASGNLDAEVKLNNRYDSYSLRSLDKLVSTLGTAEYAVSDDANIFSTAVEEMTAANKGAVKSVSSLGPVQTDIYEGRCLVFIWQGHPNAVLWLKSAPGGADLICTDLNTYSLAGLHNNTLYTVPEFLAALHTVDEKSQQLRMASAEKLASIITENKRKVTSGEDTTTIRLTNLQSALNSALATLKQAPDAVKGIFNDTIKDLSTSQAEVVLALDYVKAHPEADPLVLPPQDEIEPTDGEYHQTDNLGYPWTAASYRWLSRGTDNTIFPTLPNAGTAMCKCLDGFMGDPSTGIPAMGEIGGHRDTIMREVAAAENALANADQKFMATLGANSPSAAIDGSTVIPPANLSSKPGSISGKVAHSDGRPAADAVVTFLKVDSQNYGKMPSGFIVSGALNGAFPGTMADKNGDFIISNVPAGFYAVTAGENRAVIEVKEGVETRLDVPLSLRRRAVGGG